MTSSLPTYKTRKAELKDIMFFYEAISSISTNKLNIVDFDVQFKSKIKDKSNIQLVLIANNITVGCIIAQIRQQLSDAMPYVEVQELFIAPKYRKLKGADFLYTSLEEKVAKESKYQLRVNCNINSTLNQNFYVKKGYKIFKKQYKKDI